MKGFALNDCGVVFNKDAHTYTLGETTLSGITGIIKTMLFPDKYKDIPKEVLERAAARGTAIHAACEMADSFGVIPPIDAVQKYVAEREKLNLAPIANEYTVTDGNRIASNIDVIWRKGKSASVILGDFKTTSERDKEYVSWQLSIYKWLFNLVNPKVKVSGIAVVWLQKDKDAEIESLEMHDASVCEQIITDYFNGVRYTPEQIAEIRGISLPTEVPTEVQVMQSEYKQLLSQLETLKKKEEEFKSALFQAMEQYGVKKWETDEMMMTYVEATTSTSFDSKTFLKAHPEYDTDEFRKTSTKSAYVKITIKK